MSNWDPQTPVEYINQSKYELSFNYDVDVSHQGSVSISIANLTDSDTTVIESLIAAIVADSDWELSYVFRNWEVTQRMDDGSF